MDIAIHSDFLIHWNGRDIDDNNSLNTSAKADLYFERFKSILKYGLWMTKVKTPEVLKINGIEIQKPILPRTCFTELKLSMSQDHAKLYGFLGIGVKRYFLFNRLGSPMHYCQHGTQNLFFPPYSDLLTGDQRGVELLSFFKHMCSGRPLRYDLYNESEWRIIYSKDIEEKLRKNGKGNVADLFVDPKDEANTEVHQYYESLPEGCRPDYLIPLDPWLALIIYPTLAIKKRALEDKEIRDLLKQISARSTVTGCPERNHTPIELDLPACKHF